MMDVYDLIDLLDQICAANGDTDKWGCGPDNWSNPHDFEVQYYPDGVTKMGLHGKSRFLMSETNAKNTNQIVGMLKVRLSLAKLDAKLQQVGLPIPGWSIDLAKEPTATICPCGIDSRDCDYHR